MFDDDVVIGASARIRAVVLSRHFDEGPTTTSSDVPAHLARERAFQRLAELDDAAGRPTPLERFLAALHQRTRSPSR